MYIVILKTMLSSSTMPRPLRLEYEDAFHHVMNRGRNRQTIFHDPDYFEAFLITLKEASERYDAVIHAYCLMTNHYHLLIETPKANLSQIMQHINGKYTQWYNRKRGKDGTLFRGRYKSVLVDEDSYLLQLSRYIHRNPLEVKRKMVEVLEDYPWSSYPAFIDKAKSPSWLCRDKTYQMLGQKSRCKGYKNYVEQGVDENVKRFYSKGNILGVLGSKEYREERREENDKTDLLTLRAALQDRPSIEEVLELVSKITKETSKDLKKSGKTSKAKSANRAFAMYVCKHYSDATYKVIASLFNLSHVGSVCYPLTRVKKEITDGEWMEEIACVENEYYVVKYT
jgi:putative transposase